MVKRAYLDQALRFHPDRQHDASAAVAETAAHRMGEVNQAWEVLRNPASRARYDDTLRLSPSGAAPSPGPSSPRASAARAASGATATDLRGRPTVPREPEVADLAPAGATARRRRSGWRWTPVVLGAVVLGLVLIFAAVAQSDGPTVGVRTVEEHGVGTCVLVTTSPDLATPVAGEQAQTAVVTVPCDQVGAEQIVARVPFPRGCPVGSRSQLLPGTRDALCLR